MPNQSASHNNLADTLTRLNTLAPAYDLGRLQALRKEVRGLKKRKTRTPFPAKPNEPEYAFHVGGRTELQFNVGFDEHDDKAPALR